MNDTVPSVREPSGRSPLDLLLGVVAVLLHLLALWLVLVSGLVAPLWAIVVLGVVWLAACYPLLRGLRAGARWGVLVPLALVAFWFAFITFGEAVLGWTA